MLSTETLTTAKSTVFLWQLTIKQFLGNSDRQSFIHTVLISRPLMIMQNMHWNIGTNITNPMLQTASNCCRLCLSKCSKSFTFNILLSFCSVKLWHHMTDRNHMMQSAPVAYSNQYIFSRASRMLRGVTQPVRMLCVCQSVTCLCVCVWNFFSDQPPISKLVWPISMKFGMMGGFKG